MSAISNTDVLILCGGMGTRLKEVEAEVPKVMVDLNGRPFLDILVEYLRFQGVERVVLCTGYKASLIEDYYRNKDLDIVIDFSREDEPLGTGGGIYNAREIVTSESFIVLNGDSYCPADLTKLLEQHERKKAAATLTAHKMAQADDYGNIVVDESLNIVSFEEKKKGAENILVNAGVYCFNRSIFDLMPNEKRFSLESDLFPGLTDQGLYAFLTDETFWDIGTPERLRKAREHLKISP